jgi:hypothetical protein
MLPEPVGDASPGLQPVMSRSWAHRRIRLSPSLALDLDLFKPSREVRGVKKRPLTIKSSKALDIDNNCSI